MPFTYTRDGITYYYRSEVGEGEFARVLPVAATPEPAPTSIDESSDE